ncbi:MAG: tetratricopeptide repeat protein [Acidobacteriota bacterium]
MIRLRRCAGAFCAFTRGCVLLLGAALALAGCFGKSSGRSPPRSHRVSVNYNMARVYLNQGKIQKAIQLLEEVLDEEPKHARACNLLGLVYWTISEPEEARGHFERALKINPYFSDARVNLGVLYSEEQQFEQAKIQFQLALKDRTYATPEKPLVNLAVNEMHQGRPQEALSRAEEAIRRNKHYTRAYQVFVQALRKVDPVVAGAEYRTLVRELERSQDFHLNLGEAFLEEEDSRRARVHLKRVVQLDPSSELAQQARRTLDQLR